jgi:fluoride exporter
LAWLKPKGAMTLINILAVFTGGGLGAVARYGVGTLLVRGSFPFATLGVNLLGSLCMGLVIGALLLRTDATVWRLFLATGFMGGFTTFSAFAFDSLTLMQRGAFGLAFIYISLSVLGSTLACFIGLKVAS